MTNTAAAIAILMPAWPRYNRAAQDCRFHRSAGWAG